MADEHLIHHMPSTGAAYREYMRKYMAARYRKRRREAVTLLGGKCAKCTRTDGLEIDHVDHREKSMSMDRMAAVGRPRFLKELAKCQLLCLKHHIEKTTRERGQEPARGTHGTVSAYRYCGPPKCERCKMAWREMQRKWREKQEVSRHRPITGNRRNF